ncbi:ATP-binding protein [Scytonema sp. PCC 10023]|uniref:hybrid sensor histidine kinase/response regulator n=1 Tax=Scytonema sp. PCC 10023 TaxID=1680591 RepID=UPI0039C7202B
MPETRTLLIIDDCPEDRRIYRRYLLKDPHQSYQILEADSAKDGLALFQEILCDVILLDFSLPDMTGLEILDQLKQETFEVPAPVIMLTGQGDENLAVQAMKKGAQDYLSKQRLKADVLQLAVRNVIQHAHLQSVLSQTRERQRLIIQQAELLAQTQAALMREQKLNAFKSQIITTVSYEYRTPLASILAAASTLKQHGDRLDESKHQRLLQIIEQKARQMGKLVDDLLVFYQFDLNKAQFKPQPLDLCHFFSDLIEEQREKLSSRHELIYKMTGNHKDFWGDGLLLRQIFVNLMSNAIKYSPDGGKIEFHLIGNDSQVIFSVKDQGIGIPIDDQDNLFQAFSRGSNVDTIPGTGLGLAIANACVELHGGDIALESQEGKGTKVTVTLPKRLLI